MAWFLAMSMSPLPRQKWGKMRNTFFRILFTSFKCWREETTQKLWTSLKHLLTWLYIFTERWLTDVLEQGFPTRDNIQRFWQFISSQTALVEAWCDWIHHQWWRVLLHTLLLLYSIIDNKFDNSIYESLLLRNQNITVRPDLFTVTSSTNSSKTNVAMLPLIPMKRLMEVRTT